MVSHLAKVHAASPLQQYNSQGGKARRQSQPPGVSTEHPRASTRLGRSMTLVSRAFVQDLQILSFEYMSGLGVLLRVREPWWPSPQSGGR